MTHTPTKTVSLIELDLERCSRTYGTLPCQALLAYEGYTPSFVHFDGDEDYLTRGASLTSMSDGKVLTLSFWIKPRSFAAQQYILSSATTLAGGTLRLGVFLLTDGKMYIVGVDSSGATVLSIHTSALTLGRRTHILCSIDLTDTGKRWLYVNDVSDLTVTTYTNTNIDFTVADWAIGGTPAGTLLLHGDLGELWFLPGAYLDFSNSTNRRKFISAGLLPVDLGSDGSTPTGSAAKIMMSGAAWATNNGNGGGFTDEGEIEVNSFVTGSKKCFNTQNTCQDIDNYSDEGVTLRFCKPDALVSPSVLDAHPILANIDFHPGTVSLGKDLGERSVLTAAFYDGPHPDTGPGFDPYVSSRSYNPYEQGTLWAKFRARRPFLRGREMRWIEGEVGQAVEDMVTRTYIIDSSDGPGSDGMFTVTAYDLFKSVDNDRAQYPPPSEGRLNSAIDDNDLAVAIVPAGIGEDYHRSGIINIGGNELITYNRDGGINSFCKLMITAEDGADASTSFVDKASSPKTITANGNVQVDTAQFKFGTRSILFDGTGDFLSLADHADFHAGSGDFNLDIQCRISATGAIAYLWDGRPASTNGLYITLYKAADNTIRFFTDGAERIVGSAALATGSWFHINLTRINGITRLYVQGVQQGEPYVDDNVYINGTSRPLIGRNGHTAGNDYAGWMDSVRWLKGRGDYDGNFTPPVAEYNTNAGDTFTIVRGTNGTTAVSHNAGDRVQQCVPVTAEDAAFLAYTMLVAAGADPVHLPLSEWLAETAANLSTVYTRIITAPTGTRDLLCTLIVDAGLIFWWDDIQVKARLQVIRPQAGTVLFDDSNTLVGTSSVKEQPESRLSQVLFYFAPRDPTKRADERNNYQGLYWRPDFDAEAQYGSAAIREIFSQWVPPAGHSVAGRVTSLVLGRFVRPPRLFQFAVMRGTDIVLAGIYQFHTYCMQDDEGLPEPTNVQVTRLKPGPHIIEVEAEEVQFQVYAEDGGVDLSNRILFLDFDQYNVNLKSYHDSVYPEVVDPTGITVRFIIQPGVKIGSTSTGTRAIDVGTWPLGTDITLEVNGRIQGMGGAGGSLPAGVQNGAVGGPALYTRQAITLENNGEIWGGGGGGGGSASGSGSAGGGGAGKDPGPGGTQSQGQPLRAGSPGTTEAGGAAGTQFTAPLQGGAGGGPGLAGSNAGGTIPPHGTGAAAGSAIDGVSYCTITVAGDRRGAEVN